MTNTAAPAERPEVELVSRNGNQTARFVAYWISDDDVVPTKQFTITFLGCGSRWGLDVELPGGIRARVCRVANPADASNAIEAVMIAWADPSTTAGGARAAAISRSGLPAQRCPDLGAPEGVELL